MKKIYFTVLILSCFVGSYAGNIDIWGVSKKVDTLENKSMGAGVVYTKFLLPEYPITVYMLTVDLNNQYNTVETFQAYNHLGKTEAMTNAYSRLSSTGHQSIGSVNGNFWAVSGQNQPTELLGIPYSGSAINGELLTEPSAWNRGRTTDAVGLLQEIGFAVIDSTRKLWIDDMSFDGKVTIEGKGSFPISQLNRSRGVNKLVFFNQYLGQATRTDDTGIEVFIKPAGQQSWSVNNEVKCVVTRIISDKGGNVIEQGESVLSGNGTARVFLENLAVGQTISVNMGVYTSLTAERPKVKEMITGNALVMKNGELTIRNTNETYNTTLYPRTGIGMSYDGKKLYMIVIDKMAGSVGANTSTMCGILKASGAVNATSLDGGGSAQMMLTGNIVNNPADGKERPVANGWMVFQNSPTDDVISRLEFESYRIEVPYFASYKPVILGYNKYGALVNPNVQDVSFTCSDGLGHIDTAGNFIASGVSGVGSIVASYNNLSVSKQVTIIPAKIQFRLDTVLIDHRFEYPVEILSSAGTQTMMVSPNSLNLKVEDDAVCEIKNGILKGLKNGKTRIIAALDAFRDTLNVIVEIPESDKIVADNFNPINWSLDASTTLNAAMNTQNLPVNWSAGSAVNYVYTTTRAPYIKLIRNLDLYSLPDTMKIILNSGNIAISKLIVSLSANNAQQTTKEFTTFLQNAETQITIPLAAAFDVKDIAVFPIRLNYLNFYLGTQTSGQAYVLALKEIDLCYKNVILGLQANAVSSVFSVFPNPVSENGITIQTTDDNFRNFRLNIFDVSGKQVLDAEKVCTSGKMFVDIKILPKGNYILKITSDNKTESFKLIKK